MTPLSEGQVRRRYIFLQGMRWLHVGLIIPIVVLLMIERGLTLGEVGLIAGALVLTNLADANGVPLAMVVGAVVLASAAPLYLVGSRTPHDRTAQAQPGGVEPVGPAGPAGPA